MHNIINHVLLQIPNVTTTTASFDIGKFAIQVLLALLWAIVGAIVFSVVIAVAMRVFSALTPGVDEMAELRKGNVAVGIIMMGFILTISVVVIAILIHP